jgi:CBS domain-containing protein
LIKYRISGLPVVNDRNEIVAFISDGVLEVATKKVVTVSVDMPVDEIACILGKKRIKKVPVEKNGVLVGIIIVAILFVL